MRPYRTPAACLAAMTRRGATARRREDWRDIEVIEVPGGYVGIDRQGMWHIPGRCFDPAREPELAAKIGGPA